MKKRAPFGPIALTLEAAIERAKEGNPWPLLFLVQDAMGVEAMRVLSDLVSGRVKLAKYRAAFLPQHAAAIRDEYLADKRANPWKAREQRLSELAQRWESAMLLQRPGRNKEDTIADVVFAKHTYVETGGEKKRRSSPRKRPR